MSSGWEGCCFTATIIAEIEATMTQHMHHAFRDAQAQANTANPNGIFVIDGEEAKRLLERQRAERRRRRHTLYTLSWGCVSLVKPGQHSILNILNMSQFG